MELDRPNPSQERSRTEPVKAAPVPLLALDGYLRPVGLSLAGLVPPPPPPVVATLSTVRDLEVRFEESCRGSHHGQTDLTLLAFRGEHQVGWVDYTLWNDEVSVQIVQVAEDSRRQGIGTILLQELQARYPEVEIQLGALMEDGAKLISSIAMVEKATEYAPKFKELDERRAERDSLQKVADAFHAGGIEHTQDEKGTFLQQMEHLNGVHDRIWDLEKELSDKSPTMRLISLGAQRVEPELDPVQLEAAAKAAHEAVRSNSDRNYAWDDLSNQPGSQLAKEFYLKQFAETGKIVLYKNDNYPEWDDHRQRAKELLKELSLKSNMVSTDVSFQMPGWETLNINTMVAVSCLNEGLAHKWGLGLRWAIERAEEQLAKLQEQARDRADLQVVEAALPVPKEAVQVPTAADRGGVVPVPHHTKALHHAELAEQEVAKSEWKQGDPSLESSQEAHKASEQAEKEGTVEAHENAKSHSEAAFDLSDAAEKDGDHRNAEEAHHIAWASSDYAARIETQKGSEAQHGHAQLALIHQTMKLFHGSQILVERTEALREVAPTLEGGGYSQAAEEAIRATRAAVVSPSTLHDHPTPSGHVAALHAAAASAHAEALWRALDNTTLEAHRKIGSAHTALSLSYTQAQDAFDAANLDIHGAGREPAASETPETSPADSGLPEARETVSEPPTPESTIDSGTYLASLAMEPLLKEKDLYQDVGEKIGMARKDLVALRKQYEIGGAIQLQDLVVLEEDPSLAGRLVTREQQLGKRAEFLGELRDAGVVAGAAYIASRLYAMVPDRPEDTSEGRYLFAQGAELLKERALGWHTFSEGVNAVWDIAAELGGGSISAERSAELVALAEARSASWSVLREHLGKGDAEGNDYMGFNCRTEEARVAADAYMHCRQEHAQAVNKAKYSTRMANLEITLAWKGLGADFQRQLGSHARRRSLIERASKMKDHDWSWAFREKASSASKTTSTEEPSGPGQEVSKDPKKPRYQWVREVPEEVERVGGVERTFVAESLLETFGFRGLEYGNWMELEASREHTQAAGQALQDLADILGIKADQVGLQGTMALSFGARGSGRFSAHYEAGRAVVNLTKTRGGGSLGHEWGHAMDNFLARASSGFASHHLTFVSGNDWAPPGPGLAKEVEEAFRALQEAISKGVKMRTAEYTAEPREKPRHRSHATLNGLLRQHPTAPDLAVQGFMKAWNRQHLAVLVGDNRALKTYNKALVGAADYAADHTGSPLTVRLLQSGGGQSDFLATAKAMGTYWERPVELFARAWEAYLFDRLEKAGRKNSYLVAGCSEDRAVDYAAMNPILESHGGLTSIYPRGEERQRIYKAMDNLMEALVTSGAFETKGKAS